MNQYLIYIIPLFLFFVTFEMIADAVTHKKVYRFEDTVTNISLGLGQQIIEALIKTIFAIVFLWVYKKSPFKLPDTLWTFLAVIIICDFIFYWFHRLSHTVNVLWAVHIVHHQSREFNLSVSLRQPWLHKFAMFAFFIIIPFFGVSPALMIIVFAIQTFYQFWLHTRLIGKLGIFEKIFVTPSHHRVHHGTNDIYINKNYGNTLIIWDKLFGTFQAETEQVVFGISKPYNSTDPVWANFYYWKELIGNIKSKKGFLNKLKAFFQKPSIIIETENETTKEKPASYKIPGRLMLYIIIQYILIFVSAFFFLLKQDSLSFTWKIVSVIFIIWSIYNFSALMQKKRYSVHWELIRIVVMCLLVYLFLIFNK